MRRRPHHAIGWHRARDRRRGGRIENIRSGRETRAEELAIGGIKLGRIPEAGKSKGIQHAELVGYVPGSSEVDRGGDVAAECRARNIVVPQVGAAFAAGQQFLISAYIHVAAGVAGPPGEIQLLEVVGLKAELLGRHAGPHFPVAAVAEEPVAHRVDGSGRQKCCGTGLASGGIKRNADIHGRAIGQLEVLILVGLPRCRLCSS